MVSSSVVAMVSMAFGILGLAACLCCKDVDSKMTNKVSGILFGLGLITVSTTNGPLTLDRGVP
jgi:formate/nitrite transporter FocA (FNT family)